LRGEMTFPQRPARGSIATCFNRRFVIGDQVSREAGKGGGRSLWFRRGVKNKTGGSGTFIGGRRCRHQKLEKGKF